MVKYLKEINHTTKKEKEDMYMTNPRHQRRHYRTAQKEVQNSINDVSLLELDFKKTTFIIALIALIQGLVLGLAIRKK